MLSCNYLFAIVSYVTDLLDVKKNQAILCNYKYIFGMNNSITDLLSHLTSVFVFQHLFFLQKHIELVLRNELLEMNVQSQGLQENITTIGHAKLQNICNRIILTFKWKDQTQSDVALNQLLKSSTLAETEEKKH